MANTLDVQREREQAYWDTVRRRQAGRLLRVEDIEANELRPCYEGNGDLYSENRQLFLERIRQDGGWQDKHVLDYCCGLGNWAVYYALTGAARATGFDMTAAGIEAGRDHVRRQGLDGKVDLQVADATALPFPEASFDLVIGHGVIHHTIKYPGIFENLHRIMKPGTRAYFLENLADFPLWRLWWWWKGEVPEGDVPIFAREVREKTRMFQDVEIVGDSFVHAIKTFVYRKDMTPWRRRVLRASHRTDDVLFRMAPGLRRWGSMCVIVLTKAAR